MTCSTSPRATGVDRYTYAGGHASARARRCSTGCPTPKSPDLSGAYAHALKSVAVGPDDALYVSVGSTENVSASDRDADARARRRSCASPPGGGEAARPSPAASATAPGSPSPRTARVWTAVNNRDNIAYPYHRDYDGDGSDDYGKVLPGLRRTTTRSSRWRG